MSAEADEDVGIEIRALEALPGNGRRGALLMHADLPG